MKKKLMKYICLCSITVLLLPGCGTKPNGDKQISHALQEIVDEAQERAATTYDGCDRFAQIDGGMNFNIVYDRVTHVVYAVSNGRYNYGVFTPLLDTEGKPLSYEEYMKAGENTP